MSDLFPLTMGLWSPDTTVVFLPNLSSALEDRAFPMTGSQELFIKQMNRSQVLFISPNPNSFSNPQILLSLIPAMKKERSESGGAENHMDPKNSQV